jgi:predicted transcriptional regulator
LIKLTAKAHPESGLMRDHRATYGSGTVSRVIEQLVRDGYASRESGQVELTRKGKTYTVIR